jgi:hypothetical protein
MLATGLALLILVTSCASPGPRSDIVRQRLATYQVGQTKFDEFKRDAGLAQVERPAPTVPPSYLHPNRASWFPQTQTTWVSQNHPWRIYEAGQYSAVHARKFTQHWKFVVGDLTQPISILTFNGQGILVNISPVESPQKP